MYFIRVIYRAINMTGLLLLALVIGQDSVAQVRWLAGCWTARSPRSVVEEQWMAPRAGTMLGAGRTVRINGTIEVLGEFEFTRIFERNGVLVFAANPSGQAPAEFPRGVLTDSSVVFSNPSHDFPQNVRYVRLRSDSLYAAVDGVINGAQRKFEFRYARSACEPSAAR